MSNPNDYTVGWICALKTEYVAAQSFLDEEHYRPENLPTNDNNDYTLGKVGKHNVVVAVLPKGEYGISPAAAAARDMLHSFPNVRIGLMVGIGGGAPSPKHDIRLGDIVVSAPRDGKGGVYQYDYGKTIQDQSFQQTGFLNQPPALLLAAVNGLETQYERKGHRLEEAINNILEENRRLRQKSKRPEPSTDRLYRAEVTHPPNEDSSCAVVCGDDPSNLILRPERTQDEDNPAIHYGLIASANQLMKNALVRDALATARDVLCFEMEAAGLMNQFPCLVIRGICDYSDTHKNKEWQGYAAMAAAAYAKDLLCRILPNKVEAENRLSDLLSGIQDGVCKLLHRQHDQEHKTIFKWLTPIDYASQQSDIINRRQEGTGLWLLTSKEFQMWVNQGKKTLFCQGIPGAGKTIMSSIVVDHLSTKFGNDPSVGIAYIYCNYQLQQTQRPADLLSSILKQLAQEQPAMPPDVKNLYEHHRDKGTWPTFDEIRRVLHSTIQLYSRVFIIIDALDEYYDSNNEGLNSLLKVVFGLQDQVPLNLFATSRFVSEITSQFNECILKEIRAKDDDILCYVNGRIHKLLQSHISKHPQVQDTVRRDIVKAVDGMFLLAQLHMDSLMSQPTVGDIKRALQNLPQGMEKLDKTYEQAIRRIEGQQEGYRKLAKKILAWVTYARRPLYTAEVQHALAVNVGMVELDEDFLPEVEILGSVCAGLVTIDKKSDVIRLVHYTTQEYFEQKSSFPNAKTDITATCVTYLSFNAFATEFYLTDEQFKVRLKLYKLYDYAARNWGHHARAASAVEQLVVGFLKNEAKVSSSCQVMMTSKDYSGYSQNVPRQMIGVHVAAYFGLREAMMALLKNGHDLNSLDSYSWTPLSYAAENGHEAVVKLLLEKDAKLETKDKEYGQTPLSWAAEKGHEAVVKLLLEKGAELETKSGYYSWTPLLLAAKKGHEAVVKLLLEKDAKLETKNKNYGQTPLSWAAEKGHEAVVKLLLEKDAKLETKNKNYGQTPLSWAAEKGHEAIVKLLLEKGAELETKSGYYSQTPLSLAAEKGHEAVVKLLLEKGAELETKSGYYSQTPLSLAAEKGHEAVVKLLLEKDAKLETKNKNYGQTPLSLAAEKGHEAVVKLLLEKGAEKPQ